MTAAAIAATTGKITTMVDGTMRIIIEIEPKDARDAFSLFGSPGTPVAVALLTQQAAQESAQQEAISDVWGHYYTALYKCGWFYNPDLRWTFDVPDDVTDQAAVTKFIKDKIYEDFEVDSMAYIEPLLFAQYVDRMGLRGTLPLAFRELLK